MPKITKKTGKKSLTKKTPSKKPPSKRALKVEAKALLDAENSKKVLKHIPTQEDIEGKSLEELDVIWGRILESEKALNRLDIDFLKVFNNHCDALRRISRLRRVLKGEPEPK